MGSSGVVGSPRAPLWRTRLGAYGNAVALGWLLACAVAVVARDVLPVPRWLAIHLFTLGAATTAVLLWSEHFVVTLCRVAGPPPRSLASRLVTLNAAVLAVLAGVTAGLLPLALAGAAGIVAAGGWHVAVLWQLTWRSRRNRFAHVGRYYAAAGVALLLAVVLASALLRGVGSDRWSSRLFTAHVHLAVLGWLGLSVLGTLVTLWPTVLRTRIVEGAERAGRWAWWPLVCGLAVLLAGLLAGQRVVAAAGLLVYAAGAGCSLVPFVRTLRRRAPRGAAAWLMAMSTGWLLVALGIDAASLLLPGSVGLAAALGRALPVVLLAGFIVQVLAGALSYLLVPVLARGPAQRRAITALLERAWVPRVVLANLAVPLAAAPTPLAVRALGWALLAACYGGFALLALTAVGSTVRRR